MPNLNKYSTTRQFISMSFNKYNIYNLHSLRQSNYSKKTRMTVYKRQLMAKQRLRRYYGNIREQQFFSLYKKASLYKGSPSSNLFVLLERRLDVIVFRSGFAPTIYTSRQLISHGHVLVNNKKVTISSYIIEPGDIVQIDKKATIIVKNLMLQKINGSIKGELKKFFLVPAYLEVNFNTFCVILINTPTRKKIPSPINFSRTLIDKFYSRS